MPPRGISFAGLALANSPQATAIAMSWPVPDITIAVVSDIAISNYSQNKIPDEVKAPEDKPSPVKRNEKGSDGGKESSHQAASMRLISTEGGEMPTLITRECPEF
jgi:hypothetical protein